MLNKALNYLIKLSIVVASLSLGLIMIITVVDVCGRYFLNKPLRGTYELTELMMGVFCPIGIMYCAYKKEHISIELLYNKLPATLQKVVTGITCVIQAGILIALSYQSTILIEELMSSGVATPVLSLPYWPVGIVIGLSFTLMTLIYFIQLYASYMGKSNLASEVAERKKDNNEVAS